MRDPQARTLTAKDYIRAVILTAIIPPTLGFAIYWLAPWGCDANAWLCLLPISLVYLAPPAALLLSLAVYLNRRRARPLPDGPLAVVTASGVAGQVSAAVTSLWLNWPHLRHVFLFDALIFPQGFVAGIIVGVVFWVSLNALGGRSRPPSP